MSAARMRAGAVALAVAGAAVLGWGLSTPAADAAVAGPTGNLTLTLSCNGSGSDNLVWSANFFGLEPSQGYSFLLASTITGNQGTAEPQITTLFATNTSGQWITSPVTAVNINNINGGAGPLNYYVGDSYPWSIYLNGNTKVFSGTATVQNGTGPCGVTTTTSTAPPPTSAPATHTSAPVTSTAPATTIAPTSTAAVTSADPGTTAATAAGAGLAETGVSRAGTLLIIGSAMVLLGFALLIGSRMREVAVSRRH